MGVVLESPKSLSLILGACVVGWAACRGVSVLLDRAIWSEDYHSRASRGWEIPAHTIQAFAGAVLPAYVAFAASLAKAGIPWPKWTSLVLPGLAIAIGGVVIPWTVFGWLFTGDSLRTTLSVMSMVGVVSGICFGVAILWTMKFLALYEETGETA